jgi:hypothetical protein
VRNVFGCASFLTVLRTHRISRSLFLIPQRIPASPAVVSAAAGPAPHARPAASKHHTRMQHAAPCIACGSRNTLEESCCRTCRRLRTKYRRRQTVTFTYPTPFDRGRPASDPGAAARAEAKPTGRPAAPQPATATRRSPQPPPRPPPERRRAGRDPPMNDTRSLLPCDEKCPRSEVRATVETP